MAGSQPAQGSPSELRMVLLGKTGTGKSASGNTILGSKVFDSQSAACSVSQQSVKGSVKVAGRRLSVVDTPGFVDTRLAEEALKEEMVRCISLCAPGPHAFLLVMPMGRYTKQEEETVQEIQEMFGDEVWKYAIVLFTRADELGGETIEEFVQQNRHLRELVEKCGGRCHAFSNKNTSNRTQVRALLGKIDSILKAEGGGCYTSEMNREAEAAIMQKTERRVSERQGEIQREAEVRQRGELIHRQQERMQREEGDGTVSGLRTVLLGRIWTGKSAAGNTILGREVFKSDVSSASITKCSREEAGIGGHHVTVVDTPCIFGTWFDMEKVQREIVQCIFLTKPGPHAFLLIIQLGRFTKEDNDAVEMIKKLFGYSAAKYTMVLFTHGDLLKKQKITIETFLDTAHQNLQNLISYYGNRYHVFDSSIRDDHTQVKELLKKINQMVEANGGSNYTNEVFEEREREVRRVQEKIMKEREKDIKRHEVELKYRFTGIEYKKEKKALWLREEEKARKEAEERILKKCILQTAAAAGAGTAKEKK